jgi:poly(A) polymerase
MNSGAQRTDALAVIRRLRDAGHEALLAGGCVRDELLGIEPTDYDIATDAVPERVVEVFGRRNTQAVGEAFGVILVRHGKSQIEVATFRADGDYRDGRRPDSVRFTNAAEDAARRDFTINGLFRDPFAHEVDPSDNGIIDHVGGQRDLAARVLRCIGEPRRRFGEDYLRLLRAVRFAARFGFAIHDATWVALKDNAHRIASVAAERVGDELRRMLVPATRGEAWRLLWESGLIGPVFRDLPVPPDAPQRHRPFTRAAAEEPGELPFASVVAVTLLDLATMANVPTDQTLQPSAAKQLATAARRSLKLSNHETEAVREALSLWPLVGPATEGMRPGLSLTRRFLASPYASVAMPVLRALRQDHDLGQASAAVVAELNVTRREHSSAAPDPWVTGDDLKAAGFVPNPKFKEALRVAYDAQLDGSAADAAEALRRAIDVLTTRRGR